MQVTETIEYEFEGQGELVLRVKGEYLGIEAVNEILLEKHEVRELIEKLQDIADYMPIAIEDNE